MNTLNIRNVIQTKSNCDRCNFDVVLIVFFIWNILFKQAAEAGDLEQFVRLYQGDNARLMVTDARGRTAAHLAAIKNRRNILHYIHAQQGSEFLHTFHYGFVISFFLRNIINFHKNV